MVIEFSKFASLTFYFWKFWNSTKSGKSFVCFCFQLKSIKLELLKCKVFVWYICFVLYFYWYFLQIFYFDRFFLFTKKYFCTENIISFVFYSPCIKVYVHCSRLIYNMLYYYQLNERKKKESSNWFCKTFNKQLEKIQWSQK